MYEDEYVYFINQGFSVMNKFKKIKLLSYVFTMLDFTSTQGFSASLDEGL